jgi:hypothetical protein
MASLTKGPFDKVPLPEVGYTPAAATSAGYELLGRKPAISWLDRLIRGDRNYFLVRVQSVTDAFDLSVPSAQMALHFTAKVQVEIQVIDPISCLYSGITDTNAFKLTFQQKISEVLGKYTLGQMQNAKADARNAIMSAALHPAIRIIETLIDLSVSKDMQDRYEFLQTKDVELQVIRAKHEIQEMHLEYEVRNIQDPQRMLAQLIVDPSETRRQAFMDYIHATRVRDDERRRLIEIALEKGVVEAHEINPIFLEAIGDAVRGTSQIGATKLALGSSDTKVGEIRDASEGEAKGQTGSAGEERA